MAILHREFIYLWYYFELQLRQIFPYWVLGMVIGSVISMFGKQAIHGLFGSIQSKRLGVLEAIPASALGIASPLCMYGTIPLLIQRIADGMSLSSAEGKCLIHTGGKSHTSPWGGDQTAFTESMAEAGKSVSDYLGNGERIVYINVTNRISIGCDRGGNPAEPDIHDIGILASTDPVALDQACIDLVGQAQGNRSLLDRINRQNDIHTVEIGLGSRSYTLVDIG